MDEDGFDEELIYGPPKQVLNDFTSAAVGFFGGIRTPATLITGSSLGFLFALKQQAMNKDLESELKRRLGPTAHKIHWILLRLYHSGTVLAFGLALTCVVISTAASVTLLQGRHVAMATSGYEMLRREFDYEYSVARWCFIMALLCFVWAVTCKLVLEFELLAKNRRWHLTALVSLQISVLCHAVSYINRTLYSWPNFWAFTLHVMRLVGQHAFDNVTQEPMFAIAVVSLLVSLVSMVRVALFPVDTDQDDSASEKEKVN